MNLKLGELGSTAKDSDLPYASIVVSFHNEALSLRQCLLTLLDQSYPHELYEIILVNDGSDEGSVRAISDLLASRSSMVSLLAQSDKGPAAGRNLGVLNAKGRIVAFTDPDCTADKEWLAQHVKAYVSYDTVGVEGRVETDWDQLLYPSRISPATLRYVTCNMSYRREVIEKIGLFDERFRWKEDGELACRVMEAGWKIITQPAAVVYHPVKKLDARGFLTYGLRHQYDILFYMKHPEFAKVFFRLRKLGPLVFAPEFLFICAGVLLLCLIWLTFSINVAYGLLLSGTLATSALIPRRRMLKRRVKASFFLMAAFTVIVEIGRLWGCLRFRRFLL